MIAQNLTLPHFLVWNAKKKRKIAPFGIDRSARTSEMHFPGCSEWLIYTLCWLVSDYIHCRSRVWDQGCIPGCRLDVNFSQFTLKTCIELRGFLARSTPYIDHLMQYWLYLLVLAVTLQDTRVKAWGHSYNSIVVSCLCNVCLAPP